MIGMKLKKRKNEQCYHSLHDYYCVIINNQCSVIRKNSLTLLRYSQSHMIRPIFLLHQNKRKRTALIRKNSLGDQKLLQEKMGKAHPVKHGHVRVCNGSDRRGRMETKVETRKQEIESFRKERDWRGKDTEIVQEESERAGGIERGKEGKDSWQKLAGRCMARSCREGWDEDLFPVSHLNVIIMSFCHSVFGLIVRLVFAVKINQNFGFPSNLSHWETIVSYLK